MASLPSELPFVDLAVKASAHPPAAWCTGAATEGDRVTLRVGGKFLLREADAALFVAGGVGVNPLYSMLRALCERSDTGRAALLFCARDRDELLFAAELRALAARHPESLRVCLHTTRGEMLPPAVDAAPGDDDDAPDLYHVVEERVAAAKMEL